MGCAAMVGGFLVAIRGRMNGLARIAVGCGILMALATAGFVATPWFPVGVVCIAAMGAATTAHGISCQTLMQNSAAPAMVGRVLSLWGMITRAAPAMGALIYGAAAEVFGSAHSGADRRDHLHGDVGANLAAIAPPGARVGGR
jgi:MFS family permease